MKPITPTDITALEAILVAENGPIPKEEYTNIYGQEPLGKLVRSVVGLDHNATKAACNGRKPEPTSCKGFLNFGKDILQNHVIFTAMQFLK